MNVLQINEKAHSGGAAVFMVRLHNALRAEGHRATALVARPAGGVDDLALMPAPSLASRLCFHALNVLGLNFAGLLGPDRILRSRPFMEADVVHLHNLHGGYFNYRWLPRISRLKPVVWTLHDMWAITGHCAYSLDCSRWKTCCGRCPYPKTYPAVRRDATAWECRLKKKAYAASDVSMACPSRWLADFARESPLVPFPVHHVDNGIATDIFRPADKALARKALGIPPEKVTLIFVADSLRNPFKDFGLLVSALHGMDPAEKSRCCLLLLGDTGREPVAFPGFDVITCGYVEDDARKAHLLGTADMMVFPTKADNQPLVIIESMACGCPVISSAVGGVPELVLHDKTGLLVNSPSPDAFRAAIRSLIHSPERRAAMSREARELALRNHSLSSCTRRYLDLYVDTVDRWKSIHAR